MKIQQIYAGIIPFVILQLIGLGLVMALEENFLSAESAFRSVLE